MQHPLNNPQLHPDLTSPPTPTQTPTSPLLPTAKPQELPAVSAGNINPLIAGYKVNFLRLCSNTHDNWPINKVGRRAPISLSLHAVRYRFIKLVRGGTTLTITTRRRFLTSGIASGLLPVTVKLPLFCPFCI